MSQLKCRDTRAEWFGSVPDHWTIARNKNAFRIVSQKVGDRFAEYQLLSLTLLGVKVRDVESGKGKFPASFETYQEVMPGDIVFCLFDIDETPRTVGLSSLNGMVTGAYTVVRCTNLADPRYVAYFYLSIDHRKGLRPFYTGLRKVVRPDTFLNARFPLPDLETQKAIADFLDRETARIDQLIEKKQRLVELFSEKLNAVIHDSVNKSTYLKAQPLHRFCKIVTGKTPSRADESNFGLEEGLPWATPSSLGFFEPILTTKEKLTEQGAKGQMVVPSETVLINGIGASIGKVGFAGRKMTFNQQIHGIVQVRKLLNNRFLFFVMCAKRDEIISLASNTTIPIINADRFGRISVPLPPNDVQAEAVRQIEAYVEQTHRLTDAVSQSIERLREFRSALITAAVTGQIDVMTWGKKGQTDRRLDQIDEAMRA